MEELLCALCDLDNINESVAADIAGYLSVAGDETQDLADRIEAVVLALAAYSTAAPDVLPEELSVIFESCDIDAVVEELVNCMEDCVDEEGGTAIYVREEENDPSLVIYEACNRVCGDEEIRPQCFLLLFSTVYGLVDECAELTVCCGEEGCGHVA